MKKKKKGRLTSILLTIVFGAGLTLLLYPSFANYWNTVHTSQAISRYAENISNIDEDEYKVMWQEAVEYNAMLNEREESFKLTDELESLYNKALNIGGTGVMGYIDIESLGVELPIYHGTSDGVLQVAVGHLDWSSLPVGGTGTHCVLSGHRGLPSAKLFTDLDELKEGDTFTLAILNETLTYQVDRIRIVKPLEMEGLKIEQDKDYCTLVTCTPYGINTHRLLVRGHRIETEKVHDVRIVSEASFISPTVTAPIMAIPLLILLLIGMNLGDRKKLKEHYI